MKHIFCLFNVQEVAQILGNAALRKHEDLFCGEGEIQMIMFHKTNGPQITLEGIRIEVAHPETTFP